MGATVTEQIQLIITAQERATATLTGVGRQLERLGQEVQSLGRGKEAVSGVTGQLERLGHTDADLRKVDQSLSGLNRRFESMQRLMHATFVGVSVAAIGRTAWELANLGMQAERLEYAFRELSGTNADAMLERLRQGAQGTASEMSLMQSANKAMLLGVTQDVETMGRLLEVAAYRGRAMGLGTEDAFNDIVTGIGRMSPLILDNLGIVTGGEKAFEAYAKSLGKTADALTDVEKKQMLVNKVLADAPELAADGAAQVATAGAAWQDFKVEIGQQLAGEGLYAGMSGLGELIQGATDLAKRWGGVEVATRTFKNELTRLGKEGKLSAVQVGALSAEADALNLIARLTGMSAEELAMKLFDLNPAAGAAGIGLIGMAEDARYSAGALLDAAQAAVIAEGNFIRDAKASQQAASTAKWDAELKRWNALSTADKHAEMRGSVFGASGTAIGMGGAVLLPGQESLQGQVEREQGLIEWYADKAAAAERGGGGGGGGSLSETEKLYEQQTEALRGLAEAILTPTSATAEDQLRTRLGRYQGYWDEYARRLESAATDSQSAWLHLIPAEIIAQGADAMRLFVNEEKEAFYAGQRLDQVDWEAFERRAAEEQARRAGREALVAEGVRRLGGGLSGGEVANLLGLAPAGGEAGADAAEAFSVGAQAVNLGVAVTNQFRSQLESERGEWEALGALAVRWMAKGMSGEDAIAPQTSRAIAKTIFPWIAEMLDQRRPLP